MAFIMATVLMGGMLMLAIMMGALGRVVEQRHPGHLGQGHHMGMTGQRLGHEAFQLGADPDHLIGLVDGANIRWAQGKIMGRGAGGQQYLGFTHPFRDGGGDEAQGFDGRQYCGGAHRQADHEQGGEQGKNSHRDLVRTDECDNITENRTVIL